jgi:intein-encoded DNA endonuclease-like protein
LYRKGEKLRTGNNPYRNGITILSKERRMKKRLHLTIDEIIVLYESGYSAPDIGKVAGCSNNTITTRLKEAGISIRSQKAAHTTKAFTEKMEVLREYRAKNRFGVTQIEKGDRK